MITLVLTPDSPVPTKAATNNTYGGTVAVVFSGRFNPEADLLIAANEDGTITLFSVHPTSSPPSLHMIASPYFVGGAGHPPSAAAFSPNENVLVVADPIGKSLWAFDTSLSGLKPLVGSPFVMAESPRALSFHPRYNRPGDLLAVANGEGTISTFIVSSSGLTTWSAPVIAPGALSVAFSPSGKSLASGNADFSGNGANSVSVFSVGSGTLTPLSGSPFAIPAPFVPVPSPYNSFASPTSPSNAGLAPWPSGTSVEFNPSSDSEIGVVLFAYFAGLLGLRPAVTPTKLEYLPTVPEPILPYYLLLIPGVCPVASRFSPNGGLLAIGNAPVDQAPATAYVSLFDVRSSGLKPVAAPGPFYGTGDGLTVTSLAFNKGGNLLATANYFSLNRTVSLFTVT